MAGIGRWRPGRPRTATLRRLTAVLLVLAAVILAVTERHRDRHDFAVVASRALAPGMELTSGDVQLIALPAGAVLPGTLHRLDQAVGARLTGAIGAGEPVTATRLLSSRLPSALTGDPRARLVPVRPADAAVAGLLRAGDVVDVLDEHAGVLAAGAVVAVPAGSAGRGTAGPGSLPPPVLLALGEKAAHRVAASSLANSLTVVMH